MLSGEILLMLESTESTLLLERMFTKEPVSVPGKLEFVDEENYMTIRTIEWQEGYIYAAGETLWGNSGQPMTQTISITPLRMDINCTLKIDRRFPQTYGFWWDQYKEEIKPGNIPVPDEVAKEIVKVIWKDARGEREIDQIPADGIVTLYGETRGFAEGEDIEFKMELPWGDTLEVETQVGRNGVVEVQNFKI